MTMMPRLTPALSVACAVCFAAVSCAAQDTPAPGVQQPGTAAPHPATPLPQVGFVTPKPPAASSDSPATEGPATNATVTATLGSVTLSLAEPPLGGSTASDVFSTWWMVLLICVAFASLLALCCFACILWSKDRRLAHPEKSPQRREAPPGPKKDLLAVPELPVIVTTSEAGHTMVVGQGGSTVPRDDFAIRCLGEAGILSMDLRDVSDRLGKPENVLWVNPVLRGPDHAIAPPPLYHTHIVEASMADDASDPGVERLGSLRLGLSHTRSLFVSRSQGSLDVLRALPSDDHTSPPTSPRPAQIVIPRLALGGTN